MKVGCNVDRIVRNKKKFHEAEVVPTSVKQTHIERINEEILEYEKLLETEFTSENASILIEKYQKAIEYYSALNDERFLTYLAKMKDLIAKNDASNTKA